MTGHYTNPSLERGVTTNHLLGVDGVHLTSTMYGYVLSFINHIITEGVTTSDTPTEESPTTNKTKKIRTMNEERIEKLKVRLSEKQKEVKVLEERRRKFADPKSAEEAEGELPSMEKLAHGANDNNFKTKEEILKDGTLQEKLRLYYSNLDLDGYFGKKETLTTNEKKIITSSIRTSEDRRILHKCEMEYHTLMEYGKQLQFFFKRFQTSFASLAILLNKWEDYEYTIEKLNKMYELMVEPEFFEEEVIEWEDWRMNNFIDDFTRSDLLSGSALRFDEKKRKFYIGVYERGGLYSQIKKEAKYATEDMQDFKAFSVVIEKYIESSEIKYIPISILMSIENAKEEKYARYLVKNLSFFRSELNYRIDNGETISPEDKKKAVIPDFYEVKPSKDIYNSCIKLLEQLEQREIV